MERHTKLSISLICISAMHLVLYLGAEKMGVTAKGLVLTFWFVVILNFVFLFQITNRPKQVLIGVALSSLLLFPTASSCLAWSSWLVSGFGP